MRGSQVEMRADILDKNGQWPRLRGATLSPILAYLCPLSLFSCQMYGFPESSKKTTKGEPRRGGDSLFTTHTVIRIPDPRGFKVGQDFMTCTLCC